MTGDTNVTDRRTDGLLTIDNRAL